MEKHAGEYGVHTCKPSAQEAEQDGLRSARSQTETNPEEQECQGIFSDLGFPVFSQALPPFLCFAESLK